MLPVRTLVVMALAALAVAPLDARQAAPRAVNVTVGDNMRFDPATIAAKPGESLRIVVKDVGQMPKVAMGHNFVLLKKGANPKDVADKCATARDTDFIAAAVGDQILANTRLVGPGETVETTFKAPTQPGSYTYLCTFPGHFNAGMKGVLTVR